MELTPSQLKADVLKKMTINNEIIRLAEKDNYWLKKHLRILDNQIEEEKEGESSISDLLDIAKAGLK